MKKAPTEGARSFDKPTMKGATPGCPQQSNSSDCGVYVLQYIESFFQVLTLHLAFTADVMLALIWNAVTELHTNSCTKPEF